MWTWIIYSMYNIFILAVETEFIHLICASMKLLTVQTELYWMYMSEKGCISVVVTQGILL